VIGPVLIAISNLSSVLQIRPDMTNLIMFDTDRNINLSDFF
jgi:hypothetical protein